MENHHQFKVEMTCGGCSGAIERAVKRVNGVSKVETNLKDQTVDVYGTAEKNIVRAAIEKTGKKLLM